jgi:hypothetical protein
VALLLGQAFNTVEVTLYEWDHTAERPQYAGVGRCLSRPGWWPGHRMAADVAGSTQEICRRTGRWLMCCRSADPRSAAAGVWQPREMPFAVSASGSQGNTQPRGRGESGGKPLGSDRGYDHSARVGCVAEPARKGETLGRPGSAPNSAGPGMSVHRPRCCSAMPRGADQPVRRPGPSVTRAHEKSANAGARSARSNG